MYSFGLSGRGVRAHLGKIYNVDVPPGLIIRVTGAVIEEEREWRNRPLEKPYAAAYTDALGAKGKPGGKSRAKSVYAALGVNFEGGKEVLGLWIAETESAKFWMGVLD